MEDQVPFKVFTFWKEGDKPEVRRFGVEKSVVTSYHYLNAKIQDVYPGLKGKAYSIAWKDEDGDDVMISTDEEVMTALQALGGDVIKLYIYCKGGDAKDDDVDIVITASTTNANEAGGSSAVHYGVVCDACDAPVVGFRYKCTVCADFDLCARCEAAGCHPEHCMVRVPTPSMPRTIIKAAIKRSRHFLKTVAGAVGEDCPYKKHRRERSGERRHRGDHHGPHGPRGPHGGDHHHRRTRVSWLDTFASYMNEFANLAGDLDLDTEKPKAPADNPQETKPQEGQEKAQSAQESTAEAPTSTAEAPKSTAGSSKSTAGSSKSTAEASKSTAEGPKSTAEAPKTSPKQPRSTPSPIAQYQCQITPETLNNLRGMIEAYFGADFSAFMPTPTPTPAEASATATANASTSAAAQTDVEMGQGDRKASEYKNVTIKTESHVANDERDSSPDKTDDWTMINKEKDLMDATASAPRELVAPIGFNLPEEFQERVKINDGGLYPPLNTATAVLNPKEKEAASAPQEPQPATAAQVAAQAAPPQAAATPPKATPLQNPQTAPPQPRQRHPKPHIEAAIQHMLAMGFTNEGGWLTQLLESKDGNIAAILDLLAPVNPK